MQFCVRNKGIGLQACNAYHIEALIILTPPVTGHDRRGTVTVGSADRGRVTGEEDTARTAEVVPQQGLEP